MNKELDWIRKLGRSVFVMLLSVGVMAHGKAAERYKPVTVMCGDAKVTMRCGSSSSCQQSVIELTRHDGKRLMLKKPKGLDRFATGIGLACAKAADDRSFVQVEYGLLQQDCKVCEWEVLYDLKGKKLNDNDPAVLFDKEVAAAADGDGYYPNNKQFEALHDQLKLEKTHLQYLESGHQ